MAKLEHAEEVRALVDEGRLAEAQELHRQFTAQPLEKMRKGNGEVINISDLLAAKEIIVQAVDGYLKSPKQPNGKDG